MISTESRLAATWAAIREAEREIQLADTLERIRQHLDAEEAEAAVTRHAEERRARREAAAATSQAAVAAPGQSMSECNHAVR